MKTFYSDFTTKESDRDEHGNTCESVFLGKFNYFLETFQIYLSINAFEMSFRYSGILLISNINLNLRRIPALNIRIESQMDIWCEDNRLIHVECKFTYQGECIEVFKATMTLSKVTNFTHKKLLDPELVQRLGPHVSKYTADQLAVLAPRFTTLQVFHEETKRCANVQCLTRLSSNQLGDYCSQECLLQEDE